MASKFAAIQKQLEKAGAATSKKVVPIREPETKAALSDPAEVPPEASTAKRKIAPVRVGKIHIGGYFSRDFKRSLMLVRAQTGLSEQALLTGALNDLFRAHNVPVVDSDE